MKIALHLLNGWEYLAGLSFEQSLNRMLTKKNVLLRDVACLV